MRRVPARRLLATTAIALTGVVGGCIASPARVGEGELPAQDDTLPSGYGSLRQDQVSVELVSGDLRLRITPLDPSVLRLTAPDTESRLAAMLERVGGERENTTTILVTAYTEAPAATFEPRDVRLDLRGGRLPILEVHPISPEWGTGQLRQGSPMTAVYRFEGVVRWLEEGPRFEYLDISREGWRAILPTLDRERVSVLARARGR